MRIIALMDIHGDQARLKALKSHIQTADLTILAGDITDYGRSPKMRAILERVTSWTPHLFAVIGNCDYPETSMVLEQMNVSIENHIRQFNDINFMGLGASLPTPNGSTPNEITDEDIQAHINRTNPIPVSAPLVLVSHQPPFHTINDMLRTGAHVGSKSVRSFIEKQQPLICFTGHIHEGSGIDYIGDTPVVNPGPAYLGYFVTAEITTRVDHLEIARA